MTGKTPWRPLLWLSLATVSPGNGQALRAKDGHPKSKPICVLKISHSLLKCSLQEFVPFSFKSYELVFKSQLPQTQIILQKDLLRQSSIQFLKGLFCSCWTFDIHIPVKSSVGLVIVSRFEIVSFTFFRSSKSFLWSRKGSCHSSRGLWGKRCVYVCRRKRVLGLTRLVQMLSEFQSFSTSKRRLSVTARSLFLSLSPVFLKQP